jgi:flagellar capping protein FliD
LSQTGQLEFDTSKFEDAFSSNADDASTLLSGATTGFVNQLATVIDRFADDNSDGMLYDRADSLQTVIDGLDKRMTNEQTKIDSYESRLRSQFAKMEEIESTFNAASEAIKALLPQSNSDSNN